MIKFFIEIKQWWIIYKLTSKPDVEEYLAENKLYVDWIGRIWGIIEVPEDMAKIPASNQAYVVNKLGELNEVLYKLNISDLVIPSVTSKSRDTYLLILSPPFEYFNLKVITLFTGLSTGFYYLVKHFNLIKLITDLI